LNLAFWHAVADARSLAQSSDLRDTIWGQIDKTGAEMHEHPMVQKMGLVTLQTNWPRHGRSTSHAAARGAAGPVHGGSSERGGVHSSAGPAHVQLLRDRHRQRPRNSAGNPAESEALALGQHTGPQPRERAAPSWLEDQRNGVTLVGPSSFVVEPRDTAGVGAAGIRAQALAKAKQRSKTLLGSSLTRQQATPHPRTSTK
jgi:hypothetical protein